MIDMISKLLKYSTASETEIVKEKINIEEILKSIFKELISVNLNRDITLIIETGLPTVFADKILIRQVIYNILSNAVKFTKNREAALINVGCTITGEEYIFYVKDNGAGFDMDSSSKLFSIFQRLHASDEFEGSGIGLVTVKKIIQRHGGRVWIEGKTEIGATVYFTLPFEG
jgi:light-regulated signal transduction histidine kinase (bacteriophytochrome)